MWEGKSSWLKNKLYAEAAKIYGKNEISIREIVKENEIHVSFTIAPQTAKFITTVHKCLVKMKKALILGRKTWTKTMLTQLLL